MCVAYVDDGNDDYEIEAETNKLACEENRIFSVNNIHISDQ